MKKAISTIVAIGFISSMQVNTAYAGHGPIEVFNPLWVPVAILSTVAATVATIVQPPVVYERRGYSEPPQAVIYKEPRHYRQEHYNERYQDDRDRAYEGPRYREYR
jgi:hypothetical protein